MIPSLFVLILATKFCICLSADKSYQFPSSFVDKYEVCLLFSPAVIKLGLGFDYLSFINLSLSFCCQFAISCEKLFTTVTTCVIIVFVFVMCAERGHSWFPAWSCTTDRAPYANGGPGMDSVWAGQLPTQRGLKDQWIWSFNYLFYLNSCNNRPLSFIFYFVGVGVDWWL